MAPQTYAEKATAIAEGEAAKKVRETGPNTSAVIRTYQAADGLKLDNDTGYPWCASFVCWCFEQAGRPLIELKESASVGFMLQYATQHKWNVPQSAVRRGDCVVFFWPGDDWPDHIGLATGKPDALYLPTVEGNTGPQFGAAPDGVYHKRRPLSYRMAYFRVPGVATPEQIRDPQEVTDDEWFDQWAAWRLAKPRPPRQVAKYLAEQQTWRKNRPARAPKKIPEKAWDRLVDGLRP